MARALVVAAPASGSGKTVITLGLLRALRNKGLRVASAKVGPDYIDGRFHAAASGTACFNLDSWAMHREVIGGLLAETATGCDIILIEGVMGLFDGPRAAAGSTADLAEMLGLPVLLVMDARHQAQSAAALVHGFATFRQGLTVAGVILNRVASERHEAMLRETLATGIVGFLRQDARLNLPSRHLGLVQAEENQTLERFIEDAATAVEHLAEPVMALAAPLAPHHQIRLALPPLGQRIAIARDAAFTFAYPHLLHHWQRHGAEILAFSPLADEAPSPGVDAVFLPGGYPELHAGKLASNRTFFAGLRAATGLVYGECGGFMVLGDALIDAEGESHAMAGLLPLTTSFAVRRLHLGYRQLSPLTALPWSKPLRGHEFHYSSIASEGAAERVFSAQDAAGDALPEMGLRRGKIFGSYAHIIAEAP